MPRPKVRPEDRQRSTRACVGCRTSKVRCDSMTPCAMCVRRGQADTCTYPNSAATPSARRRRQQQQQQQRQPCPVPAPPPAPAPTDFSASSRRASSTASAVSPAASRMDKPSPRDGFVSSAGGGQAYVGETACISFWRFLRQTLKLQVGPADTATQADDSGLGETAVADEDGEEALETSTVEKWALLRAYTEATSAVVDLFVPSELEAHLHNPEPDTAAVSPDSKRHQLGVAAAVDLAIAVGAQARASGPRDKRLAASLFARTRRFAFEGMLTRPNLDMVRVFMLLALYTLGSSQLDTAFLYLGIACRACIILGLHQPTSWDSMDYHEGQDLRLRLWHSMCVLDVLTSSVLGRPCTVPRATRHSLESIPLDPNQAAFNAILKGAATLEDVASTISKCNVLDTATAEALLERLLAWSRDLPASLRETESCSSLSSSSPSSSSFPSSSRGVATAPSGRETEAADSQRSSSKSREALLSKVYVSGFYYYAVVLVTRPFLIQCLMSKLSRGSSRDGDLQERPFDDGRAEDLAQVCIRSAAYTGDLCHRLLSSPEASSLPLGNLFPFQTWAFGAGLILGFCLFVGKSRLELEDHFEDIREFLRRSGDDNARARTYGDTLAGFWRAIRAYRRLGSARFADGASLLVDQIMAPPPPPPQHPVNEHFHRNHGLASGDGGMQRQRQHQMRPRSGRGGSGGREVEEGEEGEEMMGRERAMETLNSQVDADPDSRNHGDSGALIAGEWLGEHSWGDFSVHLDGLGGDLGFNIVDAELMGPV